MGGVSFTQLILNAMNGRTIGLRALSFCSNRDEPFPPSAIFQLPDEAHNLVHQFFEINHTVSPIFHEPTIRTSFEAAINSPLSERHHHRPTLALLNMIFAVCLSHRLMDKNTNPAISRRYYDIAMELLKPSLLRDWSIEKVQALLLGARYLQCSNSPDECWNVLGLAIRIAHGLELHRPPPLEEPCSEREVRKRVWWACFTLDKLLSMIYGRPAATSSAEFTCPLPEDLDDECIFADRMLYPSPKRASSMSFSIEAAKLYCILEAATRSVDFETTGSSGEALAQSVLVLDERFQRWYADVPRELKLEENEDEAAEKPLILALRANMVRILIHRPSLALSLRALSGTVNDRRANEGVKSSILQHSRGICVSTAMETINLIGRRHEQTRRKSGTSWFNLYYCASILPLPLSLHFRLFPSAPYPQAYQPKLILIAMTVFNAILILVSHVVDPAYHNDRPCLAQLDTALAMIKAMSSNHTFAQKAYSFLQQLLSCMDKSLPMAARRWSEGTGTGTPTNQRGISVLGGMGAAGTGAVFNGATVADEELFAGLFDFTQDLSETYADIGSEMSAWFDEQGPPAYGRVD
jgi:Fungal specific transcription factor domain